MTINYDAVIIGAGQAGPPLAVRLAGAGRKVAIVERNQFGGTCVNTGCIPTKTLVASARVAHLARRAAEYGVRIGGEVSVDMKAVKARKDKIVQASLDSLAGWIGGTENLTLIWGSARFTDLHTVSVGGESLTAPRIFINTGGRPTVPDWPGLSEVPYLTNTSMMGLDELPDHLIVAGGSYIGLEFAQMYRRFGSRVTVVEYADRLIARAYAARVFHDLHRAAHGSSQRPQISPHRRLRHHRQSPNGGAGARRRSPGAGASSSRRRSRPSSRSRSPRSSPPTRTCDPPTPRPSSWSAVPAPPRTTPSLRRRRPPGACGR